MIKINMGCGWRNFGKDWVHIDGGEYVHLDHKNIFKLPFDNNTVDLIYASHVLEYFDNEEVEVLLTEWKRVLKNDGILRIAVPDFYQMSSLYISGKIELKNILGPLYGKMTMGNKKIYHKLVYDFKTLENKLKHSGFRDIIKYDWKETEHSHFDDHSQAYIPHMDKEKGTLISLNVECKNEF
jgi:predicted SAM-dependent methyltransferase